MDLQDRDEPDHRPHPQKGSGHGLHRRIALRGDLDEIEASTITVASDDENPEELLEAKELGESIEQAIGALRAEYRTAILLRHVEGREYQEIADIMGLPLGTVKTFIHRARHELRAKLEHLRV